MGGDNNDFEDMSIEGVMQGMYDADLAAHEKRIVEDRRARKALRAQAGDGSLTASELAAKMSADEENRIGRAISSGDATGEKKREEVAAAVRPAPSAKGGKFPPPPTSVGVSK